MVNKSQAIYELWSSYGVPAYDENSVPTGKDAPSYPYITYSEVKADFDSPIVLTASIWDRDTSWERISLLSDSIAKDIGEYGFKTIKVDGGYLLLTLGTPFAQRMSSGGNDLIRRVYINLMGEFLTAY